MVPKYVAAYTSSLCTCITICCICVQMSVYPSYHLSPVLPTIDSKPKIQRRHSLHSPTGEPRHPIKQIVSMDSSVSFRPHSMLLDYPGTSSFSKDEATTADLEDPSRTLQCPNGNISSRRSLSNQNLASYGFSFAAQPHTCAGSVAPTTSQLQVTAHINSGLSLSSGRPNLIKQLSQASPCSADSPSPVEKDGVRPALPSSSSYKSKSNSSQTMQSSPVEVQYTKATEEVDADSAKQVPGSPKNSRRCLKGKQYLDASSHSSASYRAKVAPNHSHSNPEFPLLNQVSMSQTERTHSCDDLYSKQRPLPFQAQAKEDEISPSREKINSLSSQIYSSLDQNWASTLTSYATGSYQHILKDGSLGSESNPVCEMMQKIIDVTTPLLKLNQVHLQTLMQLSSAFSQTSRTQFQEGSSSFASLNMPSNCVEGDDVYDSPVMHLQSLGFKLSSKPLTVAFDVPCEGYMTLTFELTSQGSQKSDTLLKVNELKPKGKYQLICVDLLSIYMPWNLQTIIGSGGPMRLKM